MPKTLICVVAATAVFAAPASADAVPFWWWTPAKANTAVVHANPQLLAMYAHQTTITTATCRGVRPAKTVRHVRRFHVFTCAVTYSDDTAGTDPAAWAWPLFVATSKKTPGGIACWDRSLARLKAKHCT